MLRISPVLGSAIAIALAACASKNDPASSSSNADAGVATPDASSATPTAIPLTGCGVNFTAPVAIGDGTQTFHLIVDTGSSVLGVAGASCSTCSSVGVAPLYTPSAAASDTQKPAAEKFANGEGWSGEIWQDAVAIGDASAVPVDFVSIGSQSGFFSSAWCGVKSNEGILGLGPSDLLLAGTSSYLDRLHQAGKDDVFSLQLCNATGSLWLGGFDPKYAPAWTPLVSGQRFYTTVVSSLGVAGTSLALAPTDLGNAFVDSGGDALWLPQKAFDAAIAEIGKSDAFTKLFGSATSFFTTANTTCNALSQSSADLDAMLPSLAITFGSGIVVEAPATSSYLMKLAGSCYRPSLFTRGTATQGLPGIELGAPFLRNKVVVIDRGEQRIGFAKGDCTD